MYLILILYVCNEIMQWWVEVLVVSRVNIHQ